MAYRGRINLQDPRLQSALLQKGKSETAAVPSARLRGLVSAFGGQEGNRLRESEAAGRRMNAAKRHSGKLYNLRKTALKLGKKRLNMSKNALDDQKLGSNIALGLGIGQIGLGVADSRKQKASDARQEQFQNMLMQQWVTQNPAAASKFHIQVPQMGLKKYLPTNWASQTVLPGMSSR